MNWIVSAFRRYPATAINLGAGASPARIHAGGTPALPAKHGQLHAGETPALPAKHGQHASPARIHAGGTPALPAKHGQLHAGGTPTLPAKHGQVHAGGTPALPAKHGQIHAGGTPALPAKHGQHARPGARNQPNASNTTKETRGNRMINDIPGTSEGGRASRVRDSYRRWRSGRRFLAWTIRVCGGIDRRSSSIRLDWRHAKFRS